MRMLSKILAGAATATFTVALVAGPAMADPPSTPRVQDVVGVGSDTSQFLLDQLSNDYNATHAGAAQAKLYSWDAVPQGATITEKAAGVSGDCTVVRPTGSGAGISALEANGTVTGGTGFCVDYARSSRTRASTDPACAASGICFVALAGDAVTWSADTTGSNAPATLTPTQLKNIYLCKTTARHWNQVGGTSTATIDPFLPQTSSGTRAFFLTALGGGTTAITPGSCVSDSPTTGEPGGTLIENEGDAPELNDANAIFPYSIADYIAQTLHSASCTNGASCGYPNAPVCSPGAGQNSFGCNVSGVLSLGKISGKAPITSGKITSTFPAVFQRTIYDVVRFATTADHIPSYLEPFFAASTASTKGWACSNAKAKTDIGNYGFLFPPKATINGPCGHVS
jgi:ABC-type phosphate transport system substrate-binding protein